MLLANRKRKTTPQMPMMVRMYHAALVPSGSFRAQVELVPFQLHSMWSRSRRPKTVLAWVWLGPP